jgi:WD40 repeat protein
VIWEAFKPKNGYRFRRKAAGGHSACFHLAKEAIEHERGAGRAVRILTGHKSKVSGVAVTHKGQRVISTSDDHTVSVWDLKTGKVVASFTCDWPPHCCAYSDEFKLMIVGDNGGQVHFLRLEEPKQKS